MPLALAPGETPLDELRIEYRGGLFSFYTPTTTIQITDRRVAVTDSIKRGTEVTKSVPLEQILYVLQGQFSSPRWLYAFFVLAVLGVVASLTLVGIVVGIPMLIAAVICLIVYFLKRSQSLVIDSGASDTLSVVMGGRVSRYEDAGGNRISGDPMDRLVERLEEARQQCVDR